MRIERIKNELEKEQWSFYIDGFRVFLDSYQLLKRDTKRHNFKVVKNFERLRTSYSNMEESEVPFTHDIQSYVLEEIMCRIKILRWSER